MVVRLMVIAMVIVAAFLPSISMAESISIAISASAPEVFALRSQLRLVNVGDSHCSYIHIRIPLVVSETNYGTVLNESFSVEPVEIETDDAGQRVGVFHITGVSPGQEIVIEQEYMVVAIASEVSGKVEMDSSVRVNANHAEIRAIGEDIGKSAETDRDIALRALHFTREHLVYDADSEVRNSGAVAALRSGRGVCEDFAALFVSVGRAAGLDMRMVYGYKLVGDEFVRHAWAECWLDDQWVGVDPVFSDEIMLADSYYVGQRYVDEPIVARYAGGMIAGSYVESVVMVSAD